jgi:hypothetical protein
MRKGERERRAGMTMINKWRVLVLLTVNVLSCGFLPAAAHSQAWHDTSSVASSVFVCGDWGKNCKKVGSPKVVKAMRRCLFE